MIRIIWQKLKEAGLSTIFLQFDGTEDAVYEKLRGRPLLAQKLEAIWHCEELGVGVVLVPTLVPGVNTDHIGDILYMALAHMPVVRGGTLPACQLFWPLPGSAGRFSPDYDPGSYSPDRITDRRADPDGKFLPSGL